MVKNPILEWWNKRKEPKMTTTVPSTFSKDQELKIEALYDDKKKDLDRRFAVRHSSVRKFYRTDDPTDKGEESLASELLRTLGPASDAFNGIGSRYISGTENVRAFYELLTMLDNEQRQYGRDDPLVQTMDTMCKMCGENLFVRSFTQEQIDVDRVTVKSNPLEGFFPTGGGGMGASLPLLSSGDLPRNRRGGVFRPEDEQIIREALSQSDATPEATRFRKKAK